MGGATPVPGAQGLYAITGKFTEPNGDIIAALLEWAIINRKANLLKSFSIGPTQMWMAQTPMSYDYVSRVGYEGVYPAGRVATYPQTWEALFSYYTSRTSEDMFQYMSYLDSSSAPGLDPSNEDKAIAFLRNKQTGTSPGVAEQYYSSFFKGNLVWAANQWARIACGQVNLQTF
jgi:hypothetical protein